MGKQVGETHCKHNGKVDEEKEMDEERNNISIREKNNDKVHSQGGYFTERCHFLGRGRKKRMRNLSKISTVLIFP
jgi:hypothetical protein